MNRPSKILLSVQSLLIKLLTSTAVMPVKDTSNSNFSELNNFENIHSSASPNAYGQSASSSSQSDQDELDEDNDDINWSIIFTDDNYSTDQDEHKSNYFEDEIDVMNDIISEPSDSENHEIFNSESKEERNSGAKYDNLSLNDVLSIPKLNEEDSISTLKPIPTPAIFGENSFSDPENREQREEIHESVASNKTSSDQESSYPASVKFMDGVALDPDFSKLVVEDVDDIQPIIQENSLCEPYISAAVWGIVVALLALDFFGFFPFNFTEPVPYQMQYRIGIPKFVSTSLFVEKKTEERDTTWSLMKKLGASIWKDVENGIKYTETTSGIFNVEYLEFMNKSAEKIKNQYWMKYLVEEVDQTYDYLSSVVESEKNVLKSLNFNSGYQELNQSIGKNLKLANGAIADISQNLKSTLKKSCTGANASVDKIFVTLDKAKPVLIEASGKFNNMMLTSAKQLSLKSHYLWDSFQQQISTSKKFQQTASNWNNQASKEAFRHYQSSSKFFSRQWNLFRETYPSLTTGTKTFSPPDKHIVDWIDVRVTVTDGGDVYTWEQEKLRNLQNEPYYPEFKKALQDYYEGVFLSEIKAGAVSDLEVKRVEFLMFIF